MIYAIMAACRSFLDHCGFVTVSFRDYAHFQELWAPFEKQAQKRLGIAKDAIRTLNEIEHLLSGELCEKNERGGLRPILSHSFCDDSGFHRDILDLRSCIHDGEGSVGDPEDVHYILSPRHQVGYAVYSSVNRRMVKEVFEGFRKRVEVLRRNGTIVAACSIAVLRFESCGGVRII